MGAAEDELLPGHLCGMVLSNIKGDDVSNEPEHVILAKLDQCESRAIDMLWAVLQQCAESDQSDEALAEIGRQAVWQERNAW